MEDFLRDANSSLAEQINIMPMEDMLIALAVANSTDVGVDIRNIGLLMFGDRPEKFLPGAQIELIWFKSPEAEGSDDFTEKIFTGPVQKQVRDALSYIQAVLLEEKVVKHPDRAEADRFWNYPYAALEEIFVNSVLHKSYRLHEPVEIRIYVDHIKVINYPGPGKVIDMDELRAGKATSRHYRNRRIGEFLKEIDLAEKKSTGITKILNALRNNSSPPPEFTTDEDRNYLIVTIKQHEGFESHDTVNEIVNDTVTDKEADIVSRHDVILMAMRENKSITIKQLAGKTGISQATINRELKSMKENGIIKRIGSDKTGYWEIME